jgi:hypothetical protein
VLRDAVPFDCLRTRRSTYACDDDLVRSVIRLTARSTTTWEIAPLPGGPVVSRLGLLPGNARRLT